MAGKSFNELENMANDIVNKTDIINNSSNIKHHIIDKHIFIVRSSFVDNPGSLEDAINRMLEDDAKEGVFHEE